VLPCSKLLLGFRVALDLAVFAPANLTGSATLDADDATLAFGSLLT
jgi:hypothetical protein